MPLRYEPESLLNLAEDRVVAELVRKCHTEYGMTAARAPAYHCTKYRIRPLWSPSVVPTPLRRRLLDKCMDAVRDSRWSGGVSVAADSVPVHLLTVLLDADIRRLSVQLCCYYGCSHQNALLETLAAYGKGLTSLELIRPTLLRLDMQLFHSVLLSMANLKHLVIKNIACDRILKTIGVSCSQLEILDISHSSKVTDDGIKNLLLQIEFRDKSIDINTRKHQSTNMSWWHAIKSLSRKIKMKSSGQNKITDLSFLLECSQKPTKLCSTLYTLNIANTSVTSNGILLALQNIPNLETLGEYCHIGKALELLAKCPMRSNKLQLTMANACRTTPSRLQALCNVCTKLNRLTITEPLHSPLMLNQLPKSLTILNLQNIPTEHTWLDGLNKFLSGPQAHILRELYLKFRIDAVSQTVDLSICLPRMVNLETLLIDGVESTLKTVTMDIALEKLEKIQLSKIDSPNTLQRLLEYTPCLKVFHVYTCSGLNGLNFVNSLNSKTTQLAATTRISKNLNCVYINNLQNGNITTVQYIMDVCPEIHKIGNVNNWGISEEEIKVLNTWKHKNNFKLELHTNSHWYCSECFPIL